MTIHDATVSLSATASAASIGLVAQTSQYEYIDFNAVLPASPSDYQYVNFNTGLVAETSDLAEFIFGETDQRLIATASLTASASVQDLFYMGAGTASSAYPATPSYPSGTTKDDLILIPITFKGNGPNDYNSAYSVLRLVYDHDDGYQTYNPTLGNDTGKVYQRGNIERPTTDKSGTLSLPFNTQGTSDSQITKMFRFKSTKDIAVTAYKQVEHPTTAGSNIDRTISYVERQSFIRYGDNYVGLSQASHSTVCYDGHRTLVAFPRYPTKETYYSVTDGQIWHDGGTIFPELGTSTYNWIRGSAYGNGIWIALWGNSSNARIARSTDGRTWVTDDLDNLFTGYYMYGIHFGNGNFCAYGANGRVFFSSDGVEWIARNLPNSSESSMGGNWGRFNGTSMHMLVCSSGWAYWTIDEGLSWNGALVLNGQCTACVMGEDASGNDMWVVVGYYGPASPIDGGGVAWSNNPNNQWYRFHSASYRTQFDDGVWAYPADNIAWNGDRYMVVGGPGNIHYSWPWNVTSNPSFLSYIIHGYDQGYINTYTTGGGDLTDIVALKNGDFLAMGFSGAWRVSEYNTWKNGDMFFCVWAAPTDAQVYSNLYISIPNSGITIASQETTTAGGDFAQTAFYGYVNGLTEPGSAQTYYTSADVAVTTDLDSSLATYKIRAIKRVEYLDAFASMTVEAKTYTPGVIAGCPGHTYTASMTVDAGVEGAGTNTGGVYNTNYNTSEASGTTIQVTSGNIPATYGPNLVIVAVVSDNLSATTPTYTISDNKGNTYTQIAYKGQNASAAAGVVAGLYYTMWTHSATETITVTATASGAVVAKVIGVMTCYWMDGVQVSTAVTNSGSSATPTVTSGTVNSGNLVIGLTGVENATLPTEDSDTLNGNWASRVLSACGSGGNAATHVSMYLATKGTTGSGAQTFNPATSPSTDWASIIAVFNAIQNYKKSDVTTMRVVTSMTVDSTLTKTATASVAGSASVTAVGGGPTNGSFVPGEGTVTAYGEEIPNQTGSAVGLGSVSAITTVVVTALTTGSGVTSGEGSMGRGGSAAGVGSVVANATQIATASAAGSGYSDVVHTVTASSSVAGAGSVVADGMESLNHYATVEMNAVATGPTIWAAHVYTTNPGGTDGVGDDPSTPYYPPDPDEWYRATSVYGPTGLTGNLVELTNRHYQGALFNTLTWSHPNGPNGMEYDTYTIGARGSSVTPLGNDKFLVTWLQENWHQYYQDWYGYTPVYREQDDLPLTLNAVVLDCSGTGDPVIVGRRRYDLPIFLRFWRISTKQDSKMAPDGSVYGVVSGFPIMPGAWSPDHGEWTNIYGHPVNIAFKVTVSGDSPTFSWVKTYGRMASAVSGFFNQIMFDGNTPVFMTSGYGGAVLFKLSSSDGSLLSTGNVFGLYGEGKGAISCIYKGSTGVMFGHTTENLCYFVADLNTLNVGSKQYLSPQMQIWGGMWKAKKGDDGYWYTTAVTLDRPYLDVFKWDIVGGQLKLVAIHGSDVGHVWNSSPSLSSLTYKNYFRSIDMMEVWVAINPYAGTGLVSMYSKTGFCPGRLNPSTVAFASTIGTSSQYPEHIYGPQVVAGLKPYPDSMEPLRPTAWISPPYQMSSWWNGFPTFGEMDCAEISNGKILVVMANTANHQDLYNGDFRIFAYVADPEDDPPPLKLSQRDDDKVAGAQRIGYDPQQEATIRAGWVAW